MDISGTASYVDAQIGATLIRWGWKHGIPVPSSAYPRHRYRPFVASRATNGGSNRATPARNAPSGSPAAHRRVLRRPPRPHTGTLSDGPEPR